MHVRHDDYGSNQTGVDSWPPQFTDPFPSGPGIPEIKASELSVELVRAGVLGHGALIVRGLLAPDAALARLYPEKVVGNGRTATLELSGTSQSAAVVSGAVALLLEARPTSKPEQVRLGLAPLMVQKVFEELL